MSVVVALQLGSFSVVLETLWSGKSELPFGTFALLMQPIHLAIGIVEAFVTAGIVNYVRNARPEILENITGSRPLGTGISVRKVIVAFALLAAITGGALSWFASTIRMAWSGPSPRSQVRASCRRRSMGSLPFSKASRKRRRSFQTITSDGFAGRKKGGGTRFLAGDRSRHVSRRHRRGSHRPRNGHTHWIGNQIIQRKTYINRMKSPPLRSL